MNDKKYLTGQNSKLLFYFFVLLTAPWMFTMGWSFLKPIITRRTMEKISIFGCNKQEWMAELLHQVSEESILPEMLKDCNGN